MADSVETLVERIAAAYDRRGLTLGVAESCTGGSLAAAITDRPGVSSFFLGGVVSYANEVKAAILGVPVAVLEEHGAVSEPTARAMAEGVRARLGVDVAVSITGVAGPGGGSPEKPVGLVYISLSASKGTKLRRDIWPGSRAQIRAAAVLAALGMILESAEAEPP